jgi:hypothetical protein
MTDDIQHIKNLVRPFVSGDNELAAAEIQQAFDQMEQLGLIRRTGEFRRGKPVFDTTELGRTVLSSNAPATRQ